MIAADTSTWMAFFQGNEARDVEFLAKALQDRQLVMLPPVLTELLSDPKLASSATAGRSRGALRTFTELAAAMPSGQRRFSTHRSSPLCLPIMRSSVRVGRALGSVQFFSLCGTTA